MRFRSRDGQHKRVTTTMGAITIIGPEWKDIPDHLTELQDSALKEGCVIDDGGNETAADERPHLSKKEKIAAIKAQMKIMLESNDDRNFVKSTGLPNKLVLARNCGFRVDEKLFQTAFAELQKEAEE